MKNWTIGTLLAAAALAVGAAVPVQALSYKTAGIASYPDVAYGKWEVRAKLGLASSVVNGFFYWDNDVYATPPVPSHEIDVEITGGAPSKICNVTHTGSTDWGTMHHAYAPDYETGADLSLDYHTFGIEWGPDYIRWTLDGEVFRSDDAPDSTNVIDCRGATDRLDIMCWLGSWGGSPSESDFPLATFISWVKMYAFTPGSGNAGSNNDFTLSWVDEFKGSELNTNRWFKYSWGGDASYQFSDYDTANAVVKDGSLVLAMCAENQARGWSGAIPQDDQNGLFNEQDDTSVKSAGKAYAFQTRDNLSLEGNTVIYRLASAGHVLLRLFDLQGNSIQTLLDGNGSAGMNATPLNRAFFPSGTYVLRMDGQSGADVSAWSISGKHVSNCGGFR